MRIASMRVPGWPSLPLLGKELIEQSNRRRTFVIRTAYAILLYVAMLFVLASQAGWNSDSMAMLGRGEDLFHSIVGFQFFAIYAFLPGLAAGVISAEKERDTLAMLLLTKLGAWTILWEKLLSRLMPLGMLLLLSLPLLAVAYSLGGVEAVMIVDAVWVLSITALQVGALALFCSTWFRTTAGAFVATYVIGFVIIFFPLILWGMLALLVMLLGGYIGNFDDDLLEVTLNFLGPYVLFEGIHDRVPPGIRFGPGAPPPAATGALSFIGHLIFLVFRTSPIWVTALGFLGGARGALWPRAFSRPQQRILKFLRKVDGIFNDLNQNRVTKGVVLIKETTELPEFHPISWRETTKKALGTTRYLVRFLVVVEPILVIFLTLSNGSSMQNGDVSPGTFPNIVLWIITALAVTVLATGLIVGERSRQTLDVLLATPIPTREILRQKLAGVKKVALVMAIPLLTVLVYDIWLQVPSQNRGSSQTGLDSLWRFVQGIAPILVYPAIIGWLGLHCGMRMRTQGQAVLMTLTLIFAWCALPGILSLPFDPLLIRPGDDLGWMTFTPLIYVIEPMRDELIAHRLHGFGYLREFQPRRLQVECITFMVHFSTLLAAWLFLRWRGFATFARRLKRNDGMPEDGLPPSERGTSTS
jgi:ABC-type transport system involved in multi-copper enzyme maturation permease subunit